MFEIIYTNNTTSKLTIAKNRTTLKIRKEDRDLGIRMLDMVEKIVDRLGEIEYTYRGRFEMYLGSEKLGIKLSICRGCMFETYFVEGGI